VADVTGPPHDFAQEGDQERLLDLLRTLGATEQEIAATPVHQRSALALEIVLRDGRPPVTVAQAAEQVGLPVEDLLQFLRALGFPTAPDARAIPAALVDAQHTLAVGASELIGEEAALGLARVVGAGTARLAQAVVDTFRVGFELPTLGRGVSYSEVVEQYVDITRTMLPALEAMVLATLRAHLVRVAADAWMPDVEQAAARRDLAVGFADLVGYTALTRTLSPAELARLLRRFEDTIAGVVAEHDARLVKQIGDGAMFAADSPQAGAATACALAEAFAAADGLPPVRVGLATGSVVTHYGDYYGDVVNLAARLVALARPGTVVVSEQVAAALAAAGAAGTAESGGEWVLERLPDQALKGFGAPSAVFRLRAARPE
jgi:adenylate cyclase